MKECHDSTLRGYRDGHITLRWLTRAIHWPTMINHVINCDHCQIFQTYYQNIQITLACSIKISYPFYVYLITKLVEIVTWNVSIFACTDALVKWSEDRVYKSTHWVTLCEVRRSMAIQMKTWGANTAKKQEPKVLRIQVAVLMKTRIVQTKGQKLMTLLIGPSASLG